MADGERGPAGAGAPSGDLGLRAVVVDVLTQRALASDLGASPSPYQVSGGTGCPRKKVAAPPFACFCGSCALSETEAVSM